MSFVYPSFLWGLLALSIPILIHLFNFRKAKKIYFSNVSFLENVKESTSSKQRLKHLLILASRILAILFLVLAFAQPFIPGKEQGLESTMVKIYVDNSRSTANLTTDDRTGLSSGLSYLDAIINLYPNQTKFQIISNEFAPSSTNSKNKEKALELSTELDYSNLTRSKDEVFNRLDIERNEATAKDIYVIADFQKSTWVSGKELPRDSTNKYKLIPITYAEFQNIFVDSVYLENPFLIKGELNRLHVRVKNTGDEGASEVNFKLLINDRQAASTSVDIPERATAEIIFDLNADLKNINICQISFDDYPMSFDNEFYFTLNMLRKINIVEIGEVEEKSYISYVYSEQSLFSYNYYTSGNIDYSAIQNADLLVINSLEEIDKSVQDAVNSLLGKGNSVLIIPHKNPDIASIESLFGNSLTIVNHAEKLVLENPDHQNPFFENIFSELDRKTEMPLASSNISWSRIGIDLLRSGNGRSYLTSINKGGSLYLLGSPLDDEFTTLHKHAIFVPIMYRMAALSSNEFSPLSYSIDDSAITLRMDSVQNDQLYKLTTENEELIPEQRISGNALILSLPKYLLRPGYYDLTYNQVVENTLAFNFSKKESNPIQMTSEELLASVSSLKNVEIIESTDADSFSTQMKERYEGRQLWKYALVLSLIFLLIETLFLRFL